jgi:hypothetical protein
LSGSRGPSATLSLDFTTCARDRISKDVALEHLWNDKPDGNDGKEIYISCISRYGIISRTVMFKARYTQGILSEHLWDNKRDSKD